MANFRRGGFSRQGPSAVAVRRKTLWARSGVIDSTIATTATVVTLFTFTEAFVTAHAPFTIVRSRGFLGLASEPL